jgi:flagellar motor switch protein FliG
MDQSLQNEIAANLATTRQLLPEQVEDIEQDLKRRLDYLIGGPDRIFAVYESLDAEGQKRMFDSLKDSRPEIAEELRRKTLLFEDLEKFDSGALKSLLRELDLQTIVMALKGAADSFRAKVLEHVPEGKAQIISEELEFSTGTGGKAMLEAQKKMIQVAKRLEREGQINIPQIAEGLPSSRYGGSLRSVLKLPPGMKMDDTMPENGGAKPSEDIQGRINRFLNRGGGPSKERYPSQEPPQATGTGE